MGSSKKIVKGFVWGTITNIVTAIYGFIAVPILIKYFGKSEYGLIGLAMSINVYLRLMDMGLNSTNVRFFSTWLAEDNYERLRKGFQTSLAFYGIIGLINAIVLLIVSYYSDVIFNVSPEQDEILKHLFCVLSLTAFCSWLSSCFDQLIKATESIAWLQIRALFTKLLMIFVLVITILYELSIEWYYSLTCLASLSIVPFSINKIKHDIPKISFLPFWDNTTFKEMLPYMINIFSFGLFQFSFYNLRPVFLGMQGSIESVADYRILNGIVGIVTMIGGAFTGILLPSSSKIVAQNNKEAYYKVAYDGTKYVSIVLCFCAFGMMSIGKDLITLYVGIEYLYLIPWLNLWLICTLFTHNQAISSLILASNDIRAITYSSVIASILGLLTAWFFIPYYQVGGTVLAFILYGSIQLIFFYMYYWPKVMKIDSYRVFSSLFLPYVLIGSISYIVCIVIPHYENQWLNIVLFGVLFVFIYCGLTYFTLNKKDINFIISNIINKK